MDPAERNSLNNLSEAVIGAAYDVANHLGAGFLEKVYERALLRELQLRGISAAAQVPISVYYKDQCVGEYYADLVIDDRIIVELKCVDYLRDEHIAQCLNYLNATGRNLALLLNFQKAKVECRRIVRDF